VKSVASWGRLGTYAHQSFPLTRRDDVATIVSATPRPGLAYGMGRSYGDACLNPGGSLWEARHLRHFIAFDETTGELRCESGVLLGDIQRTFMPRGWALPVTPGTLQVTVGGAIANDVHGKNHHRHGSFGHHLRALTLARTDGSVVECGADANAPLFRATIGGLGLTGVVTQATLRLTHVAGPWLDTETVPFAGLEEFFALADESEAGWEHTVAWFDCLAARPRGLFQRARASTSQAVFEPPAARTVPFEPPVSLVNGLTLRAFNLAWFALGKFGRRRRVQHYSSFLYPLDGVQHWNRMYGPKGFFQYQAVMPHDVRLDATQEMLAAIRRSAEGSFLAVLKTFGDPPAAGMLSFPMRGVTLALDFRNAGERTQALFERLDAIVAASGGRIYLAKDARSPRSLFERGYAAHREFVAFRDPGISSAMSRRLMGN
jgi:FAD/FMN-containing dehydrogenase